MLLPYCLTAYLNLEGTREPNNESRKIKSTTKMAKKILAYSEMAIGYTRLVGSFLFWHPPGPQQTVKPLY